MLERIRFSAILADDVEGTRRKFAGMLDESVALTKMAIRKALDSGDRVRLRKLTAKLSQLERMRRDQRKI